MKKCLAIVLTVLIVIGLMAVGVSAEGFTLKETSRVQYNYTLVVSWNHDEAPEGTDVTLATIGGLDCEITNKTDGQFAIVLNDLPAGRYTNITYAYTLGGETLGTTITGAAVVIGGDVEVVLSATISDTGKVTVSAKTASGLPVSGYKLNMTVGTMGGITGETNAAGTYSPVFIAQPGDTVSFAGMLTQVDDVTYLAAEQKTIQRPAPSTSEQVTTTMPDETTTVPDETTTMPEETTTEQQVVATTVPTTGTTNLSIRGAGTTKVDDGKVYMNVSTDTTTLEKFGITRDEFAGSARLVLSEDDYAGFVGRTSNVLMLNVLLGKEVSPALLQTAINQSADFSKYTEDNQQVLTFDLSLLLLTRTGAQIPVTAVPENAMYTIELPIPSSMKDCQKWAITAMDGDVLMTPQKIDVKKGTFQLTVNSLEAYTLIGFRGESNGSAGGTSGWLIGLLIAGILMLVGAALLLYFVALRKADTKPAPVKTVETEKAPSVPQNENDIFSGRTDMDEMWKPEDN